MVGPGRSSVTVTVGAGRGTVTVTVGCGCGTLTVTAGAGLPTRGGVTLRSACAQTATISASPMAALITSKALSCRRLGSFLRRLLPDRGSCWVITPLMVDPGSARAAAALCDTARAYSLPGWPRRRRHCLKALQELTLLAHAPKT